MSTQAPAPPQERPASNVSNAEDDDPWRDMAAVARHMMTQRTNPSTSTNNNTTHPTPPKPAHHHLLTHMNTLSPFSSATSIFDNGTGSGAVISAALDRFGAEIPEEAAIRAGDSSGAMLDVLREVRATKISSAPAVQRQEGGGVDSGSNDGNVETQVWERLRISKVDAHTLQGLGDGTVSHVTAGHVYFLLPDYDAALTQTLRVLKQGGIVGFTSWKMSAHIDAIEAAVRRIRPDSEYRMIREEWRSEESVRRVMERAGFVDVKVWEVKEEMRYENLGGLVGVLVKMPVFREVIESWGEGERGELERTLVEELAERGGGGDKGVLEGWNFVVVGRKA